VERSISDTVSSTASIHVLYVGETLNVDNIISESLEYNDDQFTVQTATSASEGLDQLAVDDFDCIISDYDIPDQNGIEFLKHVREEYPNLPFILYTENGSEEVASKAISAGVTDYVQKQTDTDQYALLANHIKNVVERRRAQQQRQQSNNRFEAIFEDPQVLIGLLDTDGTLLDANHTALEYIDTDLEAVAGERFWATPWWGEDVQSDVKKWVERAANGEYVDFEATHTPPDSDQRHVAGTIRPVTTDTGGIVSLIVTASDITERKQRKHELQRQNERLEQFTSVVSHDLRNPLNVAQGRLDLAQEECDTDHLNDVAQAHERMETLIDDLLTLAEAGNRLDEREAVALTDVIEGCWRTVETGDATLVSETDQTIRADTSRLKQLLENLFRNAVEHGDDDVTVTVGELDDRNGFYVADDGLGITADKREDVFDAGYSTTDDGTGFGLNIVEEITEAHGWEITITDSETGGAQFEITGVETAAE
jgi:PAS domain S-box-containing protein